MLTFYVGLLCKLNATERFAFTTLSIGMPFNKANRKYRAIKILVCDINIDIQSTKLVFFVCVSKMVIHSDMGRVISEKQISTGYDPRVISICPVSNLGVPLDRLVVCRRKSMSICRRNNASRHICMVSMPWLKPPCR